jgi:hypothetical protein
MKGTGAETSQLTDSGSGALCLLAPLLHQRVKIINILIRGGIILSLTI